jgi:polysaccharide export outer membrane protein
MQKFLFLLSFVLLCSCVPKKDILYLQNIEQSLPKEEPNYETLIKNDDLLRIFVSSENMLAVQDFNLLISPTLGNSTEVIGQQQLFGYLVDENGNIEFPTIGTIKLGGLSFSEAIVKLKDAISFYVTDPITIDIRILNYKITVLGEVNAPGTYQMQGNRTTLLQALGYAKDLTIYGNRKTITIFREFNGEQISKTVDITSADFLQSNFYFIKQNDVIVVHPNNAQIQSAGFNRNAPLLVSIASLLLSIILVISRN